MSVTDGPWIRQFGEYLISPSAVGDLVLTIAGTGLAFWGAVLLFRRQLRHDRSLFKEQLEAERLFRRSEMRRQAAHKLGSELIEAADEMQHLNSRAIYERLTQPDYMSIFEASPGSRRLSAAVETARRELDLDESLTALWSARINWWKACRVLALQDERILARSESGRDSIAYSLVEDEFMDWDDALRDHGVELMRWDGDGDMPTLPPGIAPKRSNDQLSKQSRDTLVRLLAEEQLRKEQRQQRR